MHIGLKHPCVIVQLLVGRSDGALVVGTPLLAVGLLDGREVVFVAGDGACDVLLEDWLGERLGD
jgi:hypothetical protein